MIDMTWLLQLPPVKQQAYFDGPALKPPLGVKPNFAHPPNHDQLGFGILISVSIIATVLVIFQMYSRIFYHKKFAIEDCEYH
jgi:hypothetical protein